MNSGTARYELPLYFTLPIINIGKPNGAGRIYTEEAVQKMMSDFNAKKSGLGFNGILGGKTDTIDDENNRYTISLSEVTHVTEDLSIEDGVVYAKIKFLSNEEGKLCADLIRSGSYLIRPTIKGDVSENGEINFVNLISFDMLPWHDGFSTRAEDLQWTKVK